jgi:predicted  nucleic acid-binding Zn-ribbon protein
MTDTTDIEKHNLEAHVELCAERYRSLDHKLETVENKITGLQSVIREVHDMVQTMSEKRTDQMINWGIGIGSTLLAIIGYLLVTYVFK